ncbi:uncharacterized protein LOC136043570 [Artemia franciscana]|uniref:uncharacterized protein LOC136043570 n=1 Tax=Artemia franciscana TaxID=6661 RepID=UPI0032DB82BD
MLSDRNIKWLYIKGKLNPVDVLSRPPDDTLLQTRPFSLADEEAEFMAATVQTEPTSMNSTSPKGSLDFLGLEGQQTKKYQMNGVELAPIISLMLQHGTNDYAKFEFRSTNGDALQRQEDQDAGLRFNEDRNGKNSHITVSPQDHDSLGEAASLQDQPDYIDTSERNEKLNDMKGNECIFIDPQMNPGKLEKLLEKWNIVPWLQKEVDRLILWERIWYRMPPPEEGRKSNAQILQLLIPRCLIPGVFQLSHSHVLMAAHQNAERSLV